MAVKIEVKGPIVSNDTAWIYHYFGWDACSQKDISKKLAEAAGDDVILEINSPKAGQRKPAYPCNPLLKRFLCYES